MDNYSELIIIGRNNFVNIFCKKILFFEKNNQIINNKILLTFSNYFYHFNLKHLLQINKINIIYQLDNIIFYDEHISDYKLSINSVIFGATIDDKDFTGNIKKYILHIPIFIIIINDGLDLESTIKIKLLKKGTIIFYDYKLKDIKDKRLFEII
tara:strand:- start:788 stop:1249 length:462 start_codon:yes stop_codon:yes gene_type:complete